MSDELRRADPRAWTQLEQGDGALAALGVGDAEHRGGGDRGMRLDGALDFLGKHVLARRDDHPPFAALQIKKPARVEPAAVADRERSPGAEEIMFAARSVAGKHQRAFDEHAADTAG